MKLHIGLAVLSCLLVCGCREVSAPTASGMAGTWRATLSMSGTVASDTLACSGVLDLALAQADTIVSGTYADSSSSPFPCQPAGGSLQPPYNGWNWALLAPYTVAGVVHANRDFRLAMAVHPTLNPDSLVFAGRVTTGQATGAASSVLVVLSSSGASADVPLLGTVVLNHI